jgi:hypothetical protein
LRVSAGLRSSDDNAPARFTSDTDDFHYIAPSHQIGVDAKRGWLLCLEMVKEQLTARESCVKDLNVEAALPQMRTKIQDAERRIRLHDLHLLGIFVEEVTVRKE